MRTLGLLTILCMSLSYSGMDNAEASPEDRIERRPGVDARRSAQRDDRREKLERIEERVRRHVQRVDAKRYEVLLDLKSKRPRAYRHLMMKSGVQHIGKDPEAEQRFLRAIDLTAEMGELADGFQELSEREKTRRRRQMRVVMSGLFELKQDAQRSRLAAMEARLEKVRKEIEMKETSKDQMVDRMVDRVLSPKPGRGDRNRPAPR
jgi:hypothetical protein